MREVDSGAMRRNCGSILTMSFLFLAGCGNGSKEASGRNPATAPPSQASGSQAPTPSSQASEPQGPARPSSGASIPLVDSRGNLVPAMPSATPSGEGGGLLWTAPASWIEEPPASSMRKAQYSLPAVPGDAEPGQCAVFYFGAGQGGDVKGNVDRWASQFTNASGGHSTPTVTEGSVAGLKVLKVVTEGTYAPSATMGGDTTPKPGQMLLGAIVEGQDANWFFKCTGPKKTMESHRKAFDSLIETVRAR